MCRRTDSLFTNLGGTPDPLVAPHRGYLLCFVNRSGSNLLAAALASTRLMGVPTEPFSFPEIADHVRDWGTAGLGEFLGEVVRRGSTANGVFGVKVSAGQLVYLTSRGVLESAIPGPAFVYVTRRDRVAQAVSLMIARQTGRWSSASPAAGTPTFDPGQIASSLRFIGECEEVFERHFSECSIEPLRLAYEDFAGDLQWAVSAIAERLGIEPSPAIRPSDIELLGQHSPLNDEFRHRFLTERGSPWP